MFNLLTKNKIPFKGFYFYYILAAGIISATFVVAQVLVGELGEAAYQLDTGRIIRYLLILTAVMAVRAVFAALNALTQERFAGTVSYRLRHNFARYFLRVPFAQVEKTNSGERLSTFTNDLPQAVNLFSRGINVLLADTMMLVAMLVYMFTINWLITLIFLGMFPVLALIQVLVSLPIQKISIVANEATANFNAVVNDSLQNTATITAFSLEEKMENRYMEAFKQVFAAQYKRVFMIATLVIAGLALSTSPMIFAMIASGIAVVNETMSIADFIVYTGMAMMAAGWLMDLAQALGRIQELRAGAKRLNEQTNEAEEAPGEATPLPHTHPTAVAFHNITFAYADDAPDVLHGVSFSIARGQKVAFIGGSGSGKSTILKMMLGLYTPKDGTISVLGANAADIGRYALRSAFAYVPQDSFLLPVSICENITGQDTPQDLPRLEKACADAGILGFIRTLPDQFATILTESAENLSGGQRQRIAMARAFYTDAPIILFDEATSALDPATEAAILQTLQTATQDKTVIMVAHRTAARAFCDTTITLEGGRVQ